MSNIPEIQVEDVSNKLKASTPNVVFIDVREDHEWQLGHIAQAIHKPLSNFQNEIKTLDPANEHIVICRSGGRSGQVTDFMLKNGFKNVFNMVGGMQAWAAKIDPAIQVK